MFQTTFTALETTPKSNSTLSKYTTNIKLLSDLQDEIILVDETLIHGLKDYFDKEIIFLTGFLREKRFYIKFIGLETIRIRIILQ